MIRKITRKHGIVASALLGLLFVYVFQRIDYLGILLDVFRLSPPSPTTAFVVNRAMRVIANDLLCILLINQLFGDPKFSRLAWWIFMAELFILLPVYLLLKIPAEGPSEISSPLYQPLHRMIVNPLLMITLMAGMYFQQRSGSALEKEGNPPK